MTQVLGTDWTAPMRLGLFERKNPTRGAIPAFLTPPHTFCRLHIDCCNLADFEPFERTIIH